MKKESKMLLEKAVDSLILSIEHFNRPWDRGRIEAVLILLDHSFEMLLKAAILHLGGRIRDPKAKQTIGFDACVRRAFSDGEIHILTEEQALLLQTINSLRDAAQHHLLDISEQHLYIQAQAGLTLFKELFNKIFKKELRTELPDRVLPLSTTPPIDLASLFENEINAIRNLLQPGKRRRIEAAAKLRALAIMEGAIEGQKLQPSQEDLYKIGKAIVEGISWTKLFPGVALINFTATGYGPSINLRITKKDGIPIYKVPEGTPGAAGIGIQRVDELGFYNLGHMQIKDKIKLTNIKTTAIIWYLDLKSDPECYKKIIIGGSRFDRYSQKALVKINKALEGISIDEVWEKYKKRDK